MEPKQVGKTAWGRKILKKRKAGKKYIGQFNKFKKYMGRRGEKERGSRKGEGKEMITINHGKRRQHNNHQYNTLASVPSKEKQAFHQQVSHRRGSNILPLKDKTDLVDFTYKLPSKAVHLPQAGQTKHDGFETIYCFKKIQKGDSCHLFT